MFHVCVSSLLVALVGLQIPGSVRATITDQISGSSELPAWCYDPPGRDCRWYRECLVVRFSCEAENNSYALGFGEKLCKKFTSERGDFSPQGQAWIDSARSCLQKQLVPLLKKDMTCPEIKTFAFASHTACYTDPPYGGPSFCELPFSDWFRVAWVVKETFLQETGKSLQQAGNIIGGCTSKGVTSLLG